MQSVTPPPPSQSSTLPIAIAIIAVVVFGTIWTVHRRHARDTAPPAVDLDAINQQQIAKAKQIAGAVSAIPAGITKGQMLEAIDNCAEFRTASADEVRDVYDFGAIRRVENGFVADFVWTLNNTKVSQGLYEGHRGSAQFVKIDDRWFLRQVRVEKTVCVCAECPALTWNGVALE